MAKVPYVPAIGNSMYVMVCTRLDITHIAGVVRLMFMSNPVKEY